MKEQGRTDKQQFLYFVFIIQCRTRRVANRRDSARFSVDGQRLAVTSVSGMGIHLMYRVDQLKVQMSVSSFY